jgi:hypothetical protein
MVAMPFLSTTPVGRGKEKRAFKPRLKSRGNSYAAGKFLCLFLVVYCFVKECFLIFNNNSEVDKMNYLHF